MRFTVFTPTYNRAYILPKLYDSLRKQSFNSFEWIIVDDGSTDNTKEIVESWKKEFDKFEIIYHYKQNGGKPRAINDGVTLARGEYFFIVDSDDRLTYDALEKLDEWCKNIDDNPKFVGIGAARGYSEEKYIKGISPLVNDQGFVDATNLERDKYHLDADMCEVYKLDIFKGFPFKVWEGEKFAPEQITMNEIALQGYKVRWYKDIIYISDYLDDGLTKGSQRLMKNNPMGYAMMYDHKLKYNISLREKFRNACQMNAMAIYGDNPSYFIKCNKKGLGFITWPFGRMIAFRRKKQYKNI